MRNKVKKMLMGLALIVAMLSVSSCATRESAINDLEKFSFELRDNSQYYTAKKWRKAVDKFGKIRREISDMTILLQNANISVDSKAIVHVIWYEVRRRA